MKSCQGTTIVSSTPGGTDSVSNRERPPLNSAIIPARERPPLGANWRILRMFGRAVPVVDVGDR